LGSAGGFEKDVGGIELKSDNIIAIEIDDLGRLRVYLEKEEFFGIWRTATEVHWDERGLFLYTPNRPEWSYLEWFEHIIRIIRDEAFCELFVNAGTKFVNVPESLKNQILSK
jgi:hypothetical protein